jgi:hypothetical protein
MTTILIRAAHLSAIVFTLFALMSSDVAAGIIVDPDALAPGTILTNAFPGVTLTTRDGVAPGTDPRAVTGEVAAGASTGQLGFAHDSGNATWGNGTFEFLRADFAAGARSVSLDFFSNDPDGDTNAQLLAFNSANLLVDNAMQTLVAADSFARLTVTAPNIAYVAAYWDEISRVANGGLDRLEYLPVPEPSIAMIVFALVGMSCFRQYR